MAQELFSIEVFSIHSVFSVFTLTANHKFGRSISNVSDFFTWIVTPDSPVKNSDPFDHSTLSPADLV